ncbi:MAG: M13 family metallopeptidase [Thermoflavifilum aggregans]|nr:M13 family metallopeptidase [Thermoflavifilum aggregans]
MKRTHLALLCAGWLLASCGTHQEKQAQTFLDFTGMDTTVVPGDNFYLYANGNWLKHTEIPPTQSSWGSFVILRENALKNMRLILDSVANDKNLPEGSIAKKVGDLYASGMDSATVEKLGLTPLQGDLQKIEQLQSPTDVLYFAAAEHRKGDDLLFRFYASPDDKNSSKMLAQFNQGGLGLPTRDYYFRTDSATKAVQQAYLQYVIRILTLSGEDSAKARQDAGKIMQLETALAKVSKSPVELRDPNANYHKLTLKQLTATTGIDWNGFLQQLGVTGQDTALVGQPEFYKGLSQQLKATPLPVWKAYLRFHLINNYAAYLSKPFVDASFDYYGRTLRGQREQQERWKRMCSMVDHEMGDGLGQLYVARFFPPAAKQRMMELVNNLQKTYEERIRNLDWMSDSTKQKAIQKLEAFTKKIGYPDKWKDYATVHIVRDSLIRNIQSCDAYEYNRMIAKIGKPVDRSEWFMTAPTVNAYYNPTFNEIVFPAGILQPPFFYQNGDDAVNYGGIGAVIGHEMTHGFDDEGRQYDADGNLRNWWTPQDSARFMQKAQLVIEQYNNSVILDSLHVNGKLTLGENIADIGGVAIAYAAFKNTPEGKSNQLIDGLTPDQRFFLSYAQIWRMKNTDKLARLRLQTDPHSPEMYRVNNPLSDLTPFYQAYNVQPGQKMYRPDSLRVHIW